MARVLTKHSGSSGTVTRKLKQAGMQEKMVAAARTRMAVLSLSRRMDGGAMAAIVKDFVGEGKHGQARVFLDFGS
jgi:hypothetical protein